MSSQPKWFLLNPNNQVQSDEQSTEQMQFNLLKLNINEIDTYLIKSVEWENWIPLKIFLEDSKSPFINYKLMKKNDFSQNNSKIIKHNHQQKKSTEILFSKVEFDDAQIKSHSGKGTHQFDGDQFSIENSSPTPVLFQSFKKSKTDPFKIEVLVSSTKGSLIKAQVEVVHTNGVIIDQQLSFDFEEQKLEIILINKLGSSASPSKIKLKGHLSLFKSSQFIQFDFQNENEKQNLKIYLQTYLNKSSEIIKGVA